MVGGGESLQQFTAASQLVIRLVDGETTPQVLMQIVKLLKCMTMQRTPKQACRRGYQGIRILHVSACIHVHK